MPERRESELPARDGSKSYIGKALIVDDELSNRVILESILDRNGYEVVQAEDGAQAVEVFSAEQPDLIFMDDIMPVMDGCMAVMRIREHHPNSVPVIFLTEKDDEPSLARCMDAGADAILTKPFNPLLVKSQICMMAKVNRLHQQINNLDNRKKQVAEIAESIISGAVTADNVALETIALLQLSAELFSGDILLTAFTPTGDLNILLGDFSGHSLTAAMGALPASEVFRAMTAKGFSSTQILSGINKKLHTLMPKDVFFAIQFISVSKYLDHISVCNCGMPDILLLDGAHGEIKHHFVSNSLPLGITHEIDFKRLTQHYPIDPDDRILLMSDGISEARNARGENFSQEHLESLVNGRGASGSALDRITQSLHEFCQGTPQNDDISMAEIPCVLDLFTTWAQQFSLDQGIELIETSETETGDILELSLTLCGNRLRQTDPVPLIINQIQELEDLKGHKRNLFTVLTELYANALDHGVLQLDSTLKNSAEGFSRYFRERELMLDELTKGRVSFQIKIEPATSGGKITIIVEDSGNGFDISRLEQNDALNATGFSGRGIMLIKELCEVVTYQPPGNSVQVLFALPK